MANDEEKKGKKTSGGVRAFFRNLIGLPPAQSDLENTPQELKDGINAQVQQAGEVVVPFDSNNDIRMGMGRLTDLSSTILKQKKDEKAISAANVLLGGGSVTFKDTYEQGLVIKLLQENNLAFEEKNGAIKLQQNQQLPTQYVLADKLKSVFSNPGNAADNRPVLEIGAMQSVAPQVAAGYQVRTETISALSTNATEAEKQAYVDKIVSIVLDQTRANVRINFADDETKKSVAKACEAVGLSLSGGGDKDTYFTRISINKSGEEIEYMTQQQIASLKSALSDKIKQNLNIPVTPTMVANVAPTQANASPAKPAWPERQMSSYSGAMNALRREIGAGSALSEEAKYLRDYLLRQNANQKRENGQNLTGDQIQGLIKYYVDDNRANPELEYYKKRLIFNVANKVLTEINAPVLSLGKMPDELKARWDQKKSTAAEANTANKAVNPSVQSPVSGNTVPVVERSTNQTIDELERDLDVQMKAANRTDQSEKKTKSPENLFDDASLQAPKGAPVTEADLDKELAALQGISPGKPPSIPTQPPQGTNPVVAAVVQDQPKAVELKPGNPPAPVTINGQKVTVGAFSGYKGLNDQKIEVESAQRLGVQLVSQLSPTAASMTASTEGGAHELTKLKQPLSQQLPYERVTISDKTEGKQFFGEGEVSISKGALQNLAASARIVVNDDIPMQFYQKVISLGIQAGVPSMVNWSLKAIFEDKKIDNWSSQYKEYGFKSEKDFVKFAEKPLSLVLMGVNHVQEAHFFVEQELGIDGKARNKLRTGDLDNATPTTVISAAGINFIQHGKNTLKFDTPEGKKAARVYIEQMWEGVLSSAAHSECRNAVMPAIGLGGFLNPTTPDLNKDIAKLYFEVLAEKLRDKKFQGKFDEIQFNPLGFATQFNEVLQDKKNKDTPLKKFDGDVKFLAVEYAKAGKKCALLNPSDAEVLVGSYDVGEYYKFGKGSTGYIGEEDLAATSTIPVGSRGISNVYEDPSRILKASVAAKTTKAQIAAGMTSQKESKSIISNITNRLRSKDNKAVQPAEASTPVEVIGKRTKAVDIKDQPSREEIGNQKRYLIDFEDSTRVFSNVERYMVLNPEVKKLKKGIHHLTIDGKKVELHLAHSFINQPFQGKAKVYVVANRKYYGGNDFGVLGQGAYGRVKLVQDKFGNCEAIKVEKKIKSEEESKARALEREITEDIGFTKGQTEIKLQSGEGGPDIKVKTVMSKRQGEELFNNIYQKPLTPDALVYDPTTREKKTDADGFTPVEKKIIALKACQIIQDLHNRGVIHGDIKPANFMSTKNGNMIVVSSIDFGFSFKLDLKTGQTEVINNGVPKGTNEIYMASELLADKSKAVFSKASDVYALGIMLKHDLGLSDAFVNDMLKTNKTERAFLPDIIRAIAQDLSAENNPEAKKVASSILDGVKQIDEKLGPVSKTTLIAQVLSGYRDPIESKGDPIPSYYNVDMYQKVASMILSSKTPEALFKELKEAYAVLTTDEERSVFKHNMNLFLEPLVLSAKNNPNILADLKKEVESLQRDIPVNPENKMYTKHLDKIKELNENLLKVKDQEPASSLGESNALAKRNDHVNKIVNLNSPEQIDAHATKMAGDLKDIQIGILSRMGPDEFHNNRQASDKKMGPAYREAMVTFNRISLVVSTDILSASSLENQKKMYDFYLKVAEKSYEKGDFNSVEAICACINYSTIDRLQYLKDGNEERIAKLSSFLNPELSSKVYRLELEKRMQEDPSQVIIPRYSVITTDTTAIDVSESKKTFQIDGKEVVKENETKMLQVADAIAPIELMRKRIESNGVNIVNKNEISGVINLYSNNLSTKEIDDLQYNRSLAILKRGEGNSPDFSDANGRNEFIGKIVSKPIQPQAQVEPSAQPVASATTNPVRPNTPPPNVGFVRAEPKSAGQEQPDAVIGSAARTAIERDVGFDKEPAEKAVTRQSTQASVTPEDLDKMIKELENYANFDDEEPKKKKRKKSKNLAAKFGLTPEDLKKVELGVKNVSPEADKARAKAATASVATEQPVVNSNKDVEKTKVANFNIKMLTGEVLSTEQTYLGLASNFFEKTFNAKISGVEIAKIENPTISETDLAKIAKDTKAEESVSFKEKLTNLSVDKISNGEEHQEVFLKFISNYEATVKTSQNLEEKLKILVEYANAKNENRAPIGLPDKFSLEDFCEKQLKPLLVQHMNALDKCIELYPDFLSANAALSKDKNFQKIMTDLNLVAKKSDPNYQGFESSMITTVQRIPRYALFGREFEKFGYTGFPPEDYFAAAAFKANNTIRDADNKKDLAEAKEQLFTKIKDPENNAAARNYYSKLTSFLSQRDGEAKFTDSELKIVLKNINKLNSTYKENNPDKGPNVINIMKTSLIDEKKAMEAVGQLVSLGCSVRIDSILPILNDKENEIAVSLLPEKMRSKNNLLNTLDAIATMKEKHGIKIDHGKSKEFIAYLAVELSKANASKKPDSYEQNLLEMSVKAFGEKFVKNIDQIVIDLKPSGPAKPAEDAKELDKFMWASAIISDHLKKPMGITQAIAPEKSINMIPTIDSINTAEKMRIFLEAVLILQQGGIKLDFSKEFREQSEKYLGDSKINDLFTKIDQNMVAQNQTAESKVPGAFDVKALLEAEKNAPEIPAEEKDVESKVKKRRRLGQTLAAINPLKSRHRESQQAEPLAARPVTMNISEPVNVPLASNQAANLPIKPADIGDKQKLVEWASKVVDHYFQTGTPLPATVDIKGKVLTETEQLKLLVEAMVTLQANGTVFNIPKDSSFIKQLQDLGTSHAKDIKVMANVQILLTPSTPNLAATSSHTQATATVSGNTQATPDKPKESRAAFTVGSTRLPSTPPPKVNVVGNQRALTGFSLVLKNAQNAYDEYIKQNPNKENDAAVMKIAAEMAAIRLQNPLNISVEQRAEQKRQALEKLLTQPAVGAEGVTKFIADKLGNDLKVLPQANTLPQRPLPPQSPSVQQQPVVPNTGSTVPTASPVIPSRKPSWMQKPADGNTQQAVNLGSNVPKTASPQSGVSVVQPARPRILQQPHRTGVPIVEKPVSQPQHPSVASPSQPPVWSARANNTTVVAQAFRVEGAHVDAFRQASNSALSDYRIVSTNLHSNGNHVEFKPTINALAKMGVNIKNNRNIPSCVATFKPGEGDKPGATSYGMKPGTSFHSNESNALLAFLVKKAFDAHLENPETKDKKLVITVLQDMGETKQGEFVKLIKEEAQRRIDVGALDKNNIAVNKAGEPEPIPLDLKARANVARK